MDEAARQPFCHSSTVVTETTSVTAFACCSAWWARHSTFATNSYTLLGAKTEDEVSTRMKNWRERLTNTLYCPQASTTCSRVEGVVGAADDLDVYNCCLSAGLCWCEKRVHNCLSGGIVPGIIHALCESWLTGPFWQCLTSAHCLLQMKSSASREDHLFSALSADCCWLPRDCCSSAEKYSSQVPSQGGGRK